MLENPTYFISRSIFWFLSIIFCVCFLRQEIIQLFPSSRKSRVFFLSVFVCVCVVTPSSQYLSELENPRNEIKKARRWGEKKKFFFFQQRKWIIRWDFGWLSDYWGSLVAFCITTESISNSVFAFSLSPVWTQYCLSTNHSTEFPVEFCALFWLVTDINSWALILWQYIFDQKHLNYVLLKSITQTNEFTIFHSVQLGEKWWKGMSQSCRKRRMVLPRSQ